MVVDDVEDDAEVVGVGGIDEGAEVVGMSVKPRRRPQIDSVIAPAEAAGKLVDRHDLEKVDAGIG